MIEVLAATMLQSGMCLAADDEASRRCSKKGKPDNCVIGLAATETWILGSGEGLYALRHRSAVWNA